MVLADEAGRVYYRYRDVSCLSEARIASMKTMPVKVAIQRGFAPKKCPKPKQ
jgi:hypothetical protein